MRKGSRVEEEGLVGRWATVMSCPFSHEVSSSPVVVYIPGVETHPTEVMTALHIQGRDGMKESQRK